MKQVFTDPPHCVYPTPDNADGNLVVSKGDYIVKCENIRYMVVELLGVGTFGQVFRCVSNEGEEVAIKVVKSYNRFYLYEVNEVKILKKLRDEGLNAYFVKLYDDFVYKHHLCIVVELLGKNMFEFSKILRFNGLDFYSVRNILQQVLRGLCELQNLGITHCDLKPENILVSDIYSEKVKIIDFGSSSMRPMSTIYYVQSRFYRAPEVILGIPYSNAVDMWSFGCIAYELLMGHPLFPGSSNADQIYRIHEFFPNGLPVFMLGHKRGKHTAEYFKEENIFFSRDNPNKFTIQMMVERIYAKYSSFREVDLFIDLILQALDPSYLERRAPHTLLKHAFFSFKRPTTPFSQVRADLMMKEKHLSEQFIGNRKLSMFNYGYSEDDSDLPQTRKGSVYDPTYENRNNRAL